MRVLVVTVALLLWVSPSLAEQKSPDGFGPIKFGMTKEEAWEAIGGEGYWHPDTDILNYEIVLPTYSLNIKEFDVTQYFLNGVATSVEAELNTEGFGFLSCVTMQADIVAHISNLYNKMPVYSERTDPGPLVNRYVGYNFAFDNGASILSYALLSEVLTGNGKDQTCKLFVNYHSASELKGRKSPNELLPF